MNRKLSRSQRVHNAVGSLKVEEYKARHAYLHGITYSREEWDVFWHRSKNITWGHQFGRMVGWDEVYYNSVIHMDAQNAQGTIEIMQEYEQFGGHDLRSAGKSCCHALASDVIEVAEDGMSARAYYLTPGTMCNAVGFDRRGRGNAWLWERYGSEFVFVDGEWKWFHEQVCPDIMGFFDVSNWAHDRYEAYVSGKLRVGDMGGYPDRLTEPGTLHYDYSIVQCPQYTVAPPKPYASLDDENTYSPGRTDPTDKKVIETGGSQKMTYDMSQNAFDLGYDG